MPNMQHPDLPGRVISVSERAVPIHERSGWQLVQEALKKSVKPPAEPVSPEQVSSPLDTKQGD